MSKRTRVLKATIKETIDRMDKIVETGGNINSKHPCMRKLLKLRRELIKLAAEKSSGN